MHVDSIHELCNEAGDALQPPENIMNAPSNSDEINRFLGIAYEHRSSDTPNQNIVPCCSTRIQHPLNRWVSYGNFSPDYKLLLTNLIKDATSTTYA